MGEKTRKPRPAGGRCKQPEAGLAADLIEKTKTLAELRESQEKFRALIETTSDFIWEMDEHGRYTYCSPQMETLWGLKPTEMIGKTPFDVMPEDQRSAAAAQFAGLSRAPRPFSGLESAAYDGRGRLIHLETSGVPFFDEAGRLLGFRGVSRDISGRKRDEEALRESEERLRLAQTGAHLGIWDWQPATGKATWTPELERVYGYAEGEFPGTYESFRELVHPDDVAEVERKRDEAIAAHRPFEFDFRIVTRSGETKWVNSKGSAIYGQDGKPQRVLGVLVDITERAKADALLKTLNEQETLRLGAAVEQASDAIVMLDLDGAIRYVNGAFESSNGVSRGAVVGRSYFELQADPFPAAAIREAVSRGGPWHGHLSRKMSGGRAVELEVTVSSVTDPSGNAVGVLITEKDVTQENALQRQLREAQKMEALGTLAGGITHDFNNMLGAIIINTELALLDTELSHPARMFLPAVLKAASRGKELVRQVITFSRQREWEKKALEIAPLVRDALAFMRSALPKNIAVREMIEPNSGAVLGDASQINQIVVNLCQNAAQAMEERGGGTIDIKLEPVQVYREMTLVHPDLKVGPYVRLMVTDNGCGMAPELIERIFDPFFTTRKPKGGTGLGLAVVHGVVRSYGGVVVANSEPGKGSVFSVYLPQWEGEIEESGETRPTPEAGRGERILLVDDEDAQRNGLAAGLRRMGYRVSSQNAGPPALAVFRVSPRSYDVVLTDQSMPGMSGLELAAELVKIRKDIPVLLCTGFSEKVGGDTVGRDGIRGIIMKPFTLGEISRFIRGVLDKKNADL